MEEKEVGKIVGYFAKISVAAIEITDGELRTGDTIHITGHTTNFEQAVDSMQVENQSVSVAKVGDSVGIKVKDRVRD
ncbi:MAG: translation elongation factor-like protein, partial [Deltaproteobacteria bacterium]|nr:translation elongation factor-like protein [Deltaproteobacteria bacterium]